MTINPFKELACPLDGLPLLQNAGSWQCADGHSFDVARQGYVNLLPVQKKRSRDPGDNKEMVAARRRFLNAGHYQPIAEALCDAVFQENCGEAVIRCLDAGCGEGYYMRYLASKTPGAAQFELMGLDISKWAVLAAAKRDKAPEWVVGSNANLPVLPETLDRVLCLFGFPVYEQFARVLRPGGEIVRIDAGQEHLKELRETIYPELKAPRQSESTAPEGFSVSGTSTVCYPLTLPDSHAISDLLAMTPHLYRAGPEGLARAAELESLTVTVEATVTRLSKD